MQQANSARDEHHTMTPESSRPPYRRALRSVALALIGLADLITALVFLVVGPVLALISRLARRRFDVGLGPEPLINNVYHKRALAKAGYRAETFVNQVFFITDDFDYRADLAIPRPLFFLRGYWLCVRALFRYRVLYIYFNGGPLMFKPLWWRIEPLLYRLAGIRTVVMPYGGDVQDMTRSPNLLFKHAMSVDYPGHRLRRHRIDRLIDVWTRWGSHVIAGVEWVDYLYYWDTLMLGHFSIDTADWPLLTPARGGSGALRVLHAPNHRAVKGTDHFIRAVEELRAEGVDVELRLLERVSNERIREAIAEADVIADQLVVGWYAMFALEAMASGRPVLCYLRPDLLELYEKVGLLRDGEMPIVACDPLTVKATLRRLAEHREELARIGIRSRAFVEAHHSIEVVGAVFGRINRSLGVEPSMPQPTAGETDRAACAG